MAKKTCQSWELMSRILGYNMSTDTNQNGSDATQKHQ